ncbi:MAG: hypothetical protein ACI8Q1_000033 [Parvicella sp.]|jgi:hypothetical protein
MNACSMSKDVNNGRLIQKRKYNKGFHIGSKSQKRTTISKKEGEIHSDKSVFVASKETESVSLQIVESVISLESSIVGINNSNPISSKESHTIPLETKGVEEIQDSFQESIVIEPVWTSAVNQPSISSGFDILIYLVLAVFVLPLIGGTLYLALRGCSFGAVMLNLLLIALAGLSLFLALLMAFSGAAAGVGALVLLTIAFIIAALVQGVQAIGNSNETKPSDDHEFYIVD